MRITLYGAARDNIDIAYKEAVYQLGLDMAERGHTMVFGGGAGGLMGAAANGVHDGGGKIIGITPRFMHKLEPIYDKCTELVDTKTMSERKDTMEKLAEAFIIVPGGVGTFDEFFQILTLKNLGVHKKPIALFNVCGYWDNFLSVIGTDIVKGFINYDIASQFFVRESSKSILDAIERQVAKAAEQLND